MIRVRFAPSPTGYLHIGSARTALFNWLFARHNNGRFILRIEDTDLVRSKDIYLKEILESLSWLGMDYDEGPLFQTKRLHLYKEYAQNLLKGNLAYYEGTAIRFKVVPQKVILNDLVHGNIEFDNSLLKDLVIIKSDGHPTYNFACVVDDLTLQITHVIRGDDHISNTPKQIALYKAFNATPPQFAHIPLIMGPDKKRLSKRHGATSIMEYRKMGYLAQALLNFMALLGWSPGTNKELFSKEELIKEFSIERLNDTQAIFNVEKLNWINGQYLKEKTPTDLTGNIKDALIYKRLINKNFDSNQLISIIKLFQGRFKTTEDFIKQADFVFLKELHFDKEAIDKYFHKKEVADWIKIIIVMIEKLQQFDAQTIEAHFRSLTGEMGISLSDLVHPVRIALTGRTVSPPLFDTMAVLGKKLVVERLREAIKFVK